VEAVVLSLIVVDIAIIVVVEGRKKERNLGS